MKLNEYLQYDGLGLSQLIKQKHIKPTEPMSCALSLSKQLNPKLNAIVADLGTLAYDHLRKADPNACFFGVPTLIKDLYFSLKGTPLTNGSRYFKHNCSTKNCEFIDSLLGAGSLIIGKTNTAELGLSYSCESSLFGACHNPWDLSLSPGGSSGGSAAAVAARIVPFAAGNDSGGSLRTPAACCGVFGLKPTRDSTPHSINEAELWSGLLSNHVITRSVRDSHYLLHHLQNKTLPTHAALSRSLDQSNKHLKIALLSGVFPQVDVHQDCQLAVDKAAMIAEQLGYQIEPVNLQIDTHSIDQAVFTIIAVNILDLLKQQQRHCGHNYNSHHVESITRAFANSARQMHRQDIELAKCALRKAIKPLELLFADYDLILTPAIAQPPLSLGKLTPEDELHDFMKKCTQFSPFTALFNQTGQPAMAIPVLYRNNQPPISVQFAASHHHEQQLFDLAYQFESINPWQNHRPSILDSIDPYSCNIP